MQVYGAGQYAMRLWVKPDQLAKLGITVPEIIGAVQKQNNVNPAGQIGSKPMEKRQNFTYTVRAQGRLSTPEEFGNIVIRANADGSFVRVKDVARIELGAQTYNLESRLNGQPAAAIGLYQLPGSNAVQASDAVRAFMKEAKQRFPADMDYAISLDQTDSVREGMREIVKTLVEAILFVVVVVFIFLQGWRATLIPLCAVPVSLVGTFVFFPLFGFSINTLSLFGLVLAIGLVVDDAIVVVEAVEHHIENGMAPREATLLAMRQVSGPVIGVACVLAAVFIPTVFLPGITGRLYQQFAITIAISVAISAFNALSLSPALSALLLRPRKKARGPLGWFFRGFNRVFSSVTNGYVSWSRHAIRKSALSLGLLVLFFVRRRMVRRQATAQLSSRRRPGLHLYGPYNYRTPLRSTARMKRRARSKTFSARYRASNTLRLSSGLAFLASFRPLTARSSSLPWSLGRSVKSRRNNTKQLSCG